MTDQTTTNPPPAPGGQNQNPQRCRRRGRGAFFILLLLLAAGLTGAFAHRAYSQGFHFGPHSMRGGLFAPLDPARVEDRADRMVRHLAIEVDATNDQQETLRAIVKAAVKDLLPLREKAQGFRERARELLTATNIDRAAIESLRAEQMALADQASRRFAQALADTATVLNSDQRRKIADHIAARRAFFERWHRG
jgi:Spy/CpxP family protein refolding chaperone